MKVWGEKEQWKEELAQLLNTSESDSICNSKILDTSK